MVWDYDYANGDGVDEREADDSGLSETKEKKAPSFLEIENAKMESGARLAKGGSSQSKTKKSGSSKKSSNKEKKSTSKSAKATKKSSNAQKKQTSKAAKSRKKSSSKTAKAAKKSSDKKAKASKKSSDKKAKASKKASDKKAKASKKASDKKAKASKKASDKKAKASKKASDKKAKASKKASEKSKKEAKGQSASTDADGVSADVKSDGRNGIDSLVNILKTDGQQPSNGEKTSSVQQKCEQVTLPKSKVTFKPCCPLCPSSMYDRHDSSAYEDAISFLEMQMKEKRDLLRRHKIHGLFLKEAKGQRASFLETMAEMKQKSLGYDETSPIFHQCGCSLCPHNIFADGATPFGEPDTEEDKESIDKNARKGIRNKQNKRHYAHESSVAKK